MLWLLLWLLLWPASIQAAESGPMALALSVSPTEVSQGEAVRVELKAINRSRNAIPTGRLIIRAGEETIFEGSLPGLKPQETYVQTLVWRPQYQADRLIIEAEAAGAVAQARIKVKASAAGRPDLSLGWGSVPSRGCLDGGPWSAQVLVTNRGQAPARPSQLKALVNGQPVSAVDLPSLAQGQQELLTFTWSQARLGGNTLVVELDRATSEDDFNPADNRLVKSFIVEECRADLIPLSLKVLGPVEAGRKPMWAEAVIANRGGGVARQAEVRFLIDGVEIRAVRVSELKPDQKRTIRVSWMPPQPGTYRLEVVVDAEGGILEANETNNTRQISFTTQTALPDLVLARPIIKRNLCLDQKPILIRTEVTNVGSRPAGPFEVVLRQGYEELAQRRIAGLNPQEKVGVRFAWNPPRPGNYKLFLVVDPKNHLSEANEDNNHHVLGLSVEDCRPRLTLVSPTMPPRINPGPQGQTFVFRVFNGGQRPAEKVEVVVRVDGREALRRSIARLRAGESQKIFLDWVAEEPGFHEVEVIIDPDKKIEQADRSGGAFRARVEVLPPGADLTITDLRVEPEAPKKGHPLTITAVVANQGQALVHGAVEVLFFINDKKVGRSLIEGLRAKEKKKIVHTVDEAPAGSMTVSAQVDAEGRHPETDETNNLYRIEIKVRP